jgi:inner membrane protein
VISAATVKPTLGNLVLWRSVYRYEQRLHVDAIRVGWAGPPLVYPGGSVAAFDVAATTAGLPAGSVLADDLRRFAHFSDGYVVVWPDRSGVLVDLRYSPVPNGLEPLWGVDYAGRAPHDHVAWVGRERIRADQRQVFWRMLQGGELEEAAGPSSAPE